MHRRSRVAWSQAMERRRTPRFLSAAPASVCWPRKRPINAKLIDVSRSGCRIAAAPLIPGQTVMLTLEPVGTILAEVRWYRKREAGLRFVAPLPASVVAALQDQASPEPLG